MVATELSSSSLVDIVELLSYLKLIVGIRYKNAGSTITGVIDATVYGDKSVTNCAF